MWRYLAGAASALLLVAAGLMLGRSMAGSNDPLPPAPAPVALADLGPPETAVPTASEATREEKRFNRYDKDKNGAVSRDEYLLSRRKAYAKLDVNGDGVLSFDEYAVKAVAKFAKADSDRNTALNRTEFASTRVIRKDKPRPKCPPVQKGPVAPSPQETGEDGDEA
jgi:hypothetical protein